VNQGAPITDDAFVVVVADPFTAEVDVFGPFGKVAGDAEVIRRRRELDAENLSDVIVVLVPLNPPTTA
jgi:hypothetical protein